MSIQGTLANGGMLHFFRNFDTVIKPFNYQVIITTANDDICETETFRIATETIDLKADKHITLTLRNVGVFYDFPHALFSYTLAGNSFCPRLLRILLTDSQGIERISYDLHDVILKFTSSSFTYNTDNRIHSYTLDGTYESISITHINPSIEGLPTKALSYFKDIPVTKE